MVYVWKGEVWATDLAGAQKPAELFTIRGQARDLRWSPDGKRLAFVSARGDHNFIGVYDATSRTIRYLDPGIDLDGNPIWSLDGKRIAFTRVPASRENFSFAPRREGEPWSIRVVDVDSGRAVEAWKADPGPGSILQGVSADNQLLWADGDRLVFPWERSGWLNLYSIVVPGLDTAPRAPRAQPTPLTPRAFEVEHVTLSPDRRRVIYSSNQDDIDRRHIWSVPANGGAATAVTRGKGSEWMPAAVSDSVMAFLRSDGRMAAHAAIQTGGGAARPLAPDTLPASSRRRSSSTLRRSPSRRPTACRFPRSCSLRAT